MRERGLVLCLFSGIPKRVSRVQGNFLLIHIFWTIKNFFALLLSNTIVFFGAKYDLWSFGMPIELFDCRINRSQSNVVFDWPNQSNQSSICDRIEIFYSWLDLNTLNYSIDSIANQSSIRFNWHPLDFWRIAPQKNWIKVGPKSENWVLCLPSTSHSKIIWPFFGNILISDIGMMVLR